MKTQTSAPPVEPPTNRELVQLIAEIAQIKGVNYVCVDGADEALRQVRVSVPVAAFLQRLSMQL